MTPSEYCVAVLLGKINPHHNHIADFWGQTIPILSIGGENAINAWDGYNWVGFTNSGLSATALYTVLTYIEHKIGELDSL